MSAGTIVRAPDGSDIVLGEIGQRILLANSRVRIWEVDLPPGESQPWHLHHNPYLVLCLDTSACRMDWLDGSPPRHLNEQVGGAVYRPVSPIHMLTNHGNHRYRNRLIELLDLGEEASAGELPTQPDGLTVKPAANPNLTPVLDTDEVRVRRLTIAAEAAHTWRAGPVPHIIVALADGADANSSPQAGVRYLHPGQTYTIDNPNRRPIDVQIVELSYLCPAPTRQ